ncbi:NADH-quinone oxidoreductase subunit L [Rudanella paleaurantiibacter]|uniref:NADH-quinone oxidoreductase subunit L n=1 Tax=Rudanella paleaurantiibacter TaxID=2614655 RepID=A0A7J5TUA9_9BACT|nr:NADH-quinone oxidoreductase subunit L [Rudanella paleaurantiibacter]KAB7725982.1 NADH-quinone oxidoreductase subunit L [Rudanella paleaurantiibacter]
MHDPLATTLLTLILLLPFAGFLGVRMSSRQVAGPLAIVLTGIGLLLSGVVLVGTTGPAVPILAEWLNMSGVSIPIGFRYDGPTAIILVLAHFVALLVQIYSLSYLDADADKPRYFGYLQLFVGAKAGILLASNLIVMYAFWELVGLASYLLIGFWYEKPQAARAAQKAFLYNRVGDVGFLIGILLTYRIFGTVEFAQLTAEAPTVVGLLLFMGCMGKSAQFPLIGWLPDAMEGPTPVSALLHAATMVAAGIFLLARIHPLLSPDALVVIALIGTVTTLWGGYSALFQTDIKKVLAFSTVSQLGLMVAAMGTDNLNGGLFHLLTHAFFKAGLFLGAGAVIHALHTQDMRQMGGLRRSMPVTFWAYTICAAALAGVPFLSGFLSKESILAGAFAWASGQHSPLAYGIPVALLLSSGLTALYMARQVRLVFLGESHAPTQAHPHEPDRLLLGPVVLLAVLSAWVWFALNPLSAHGSWPDTLFSAGQLGQPVNPAAAAHIVPVWLAPLSIALVLLGGWLGFRLRDPAPDQLVVRASVQYGFLDEFLNWLVVKPVVRLAHGLYRADTRVVDGAVNGGGIGVVVLAHIASAVDRFGVDGVVNGGAWLANRLGGLTRSVGGGRVQSYITAAVVGLLLLIWWLV